MRWIYVLKNFTNAVVFSDIKKTPFLETPPLMLALTASHAKPSAIFI